MIFRAIAQLFRLVTDRKVRYVCPDCSARYKIAAEPDLYPGDVDAVLGEFPHGRIALEWAECRCDVCRQYHVDCRRTLAEWRRDVIEEREKPRHHFERTGKAAP